MNKLLRDLSILGIVLIVLFTAYAGGYKHAKSAAYADVITSEFDLDGNRLDKSVTPMLTGNYHIAHFGDVGLVVNCLPNGTISAATPGALDTVEINYVLRQLTGPEVVLISRYGDTTATVSFKEYRTILQQRLKMRQVLPFLHQVRNHKK